MLVLFAGNIFAQAGWQWVNPLPSGNNYLQVKFLNSKTGFAVGAWGTICKTTNAGINWVLKNSGIYEELICVSIADSNNILAASEYHTLKSTNGGDTWNQVYSYGANKLFFVNSNTGFAVESAFYLRKTTNGGINWTSQFFQEPEWQDLIFINQQTGYASGISIGSGNSLIYKTTNQGTNWILVFSISGFIGIPSISFVNSLTGYAFLENPNANALAKTTDGGNNWYRFRDIDLTLGSEKYTCLSFPKDSLAYLCGGFGVIYKSTDNAASWSTSSTSRGIYSIFFTSADSGYAVGNTGTIYRTTNFGDNWVSQSSQYPSTVSFNVLCFPSQSTGYILGANTLFKTTNTGVSWQYSSFENFRFNSASFVNDVTGYSAGTGRSLIRTTNGGQNWSAVRDSFPGIISGIHFLNFNKGIISLKNGYIFRTTNAGISWDSSFTQNDNLINLSIADSLNGYCLITHVFMQNTYSRIYKTSNGGDNWYTVYTFANNNPFKAIKFSSKDTGYVSSNYIGTYKTTNGGISWNIINPKGGNCMGIIQPNTVYFPGNISTDGGQSWTTQDVRTNYLEGGDMLFINQSTGIIVGNQGIILKTTNGGVNVFVTHLSIETPKTFLLHQNYPNPFNPSTKINYEIKSSGFVSLKVFDLLGKEVAQLVNEKQNAGSYAVDFNSTEFNLPSGIYFYTLNAGEFKETKKMVLIK